jgi:F0F1-type ATP synthase delta subunit
MAQALYESLIANPKSEKKIVTNFINKIRRSKQIKYLPNILRQIDKIENKSSITITSPFELSALNMKNIEVFAMKKFKNITNPIFIYKINKELISGVKISTNQQELNLSLDDHLAQFKENLWKKI